MVTAHILEDTPEGFRVPIPQVGRAENRRHGKWFSKVVFATPCYSCGRLDHPMMYLATNKTGERVVVHSCPVSRAYGDTVRGIEMMNGSDWKFIFSMSITALVEYYGRDPILIQKALEIYARNADKVSPSIMNTPERRERRLAWLLHRALKMCEWLPLPKLSTGPDSNPELDVLFRKESGKRNRHTPPCRNCAALDHGESATHCPWKGKGRDGNPRPAAFADYWKRDPTQVILALDRYERWGRGAMAPEEKSFNFRFDVLKLCGITTDQSLQDLPLDEMEADLVRGVAILDENRNCTLCCSTYHHANSRDSEGAKICPFAFDEQLEVRWPDPWKIAISGGFNDRRVRNIIKDFYQQGSRSYQPVEGLIEETDQYCNDANSQGFKKCSQESDICLLEDGEDGHSESN